jgi:hypothetical protein
MPPALWKDLERLGLLVDGETRGAPGWAALDAQILDAYMTTLANAIIGNKTVDTVADNPTHFRRFHENSPGALRALLLRSRSTQKQPDDDPDDAQNMMALALEVVQPGAIDVMSLADILALREISTDARHAFKQAVNAMVIGLRETRSNTLAPITKAQLEDLQRRYIKEPLADLRKAMKWRKVEAAGSVISVKSSFEAGTLGAMIVASAATGSAPLAVAGLAFAGWTAWRNASARKKEHEKHQLAWLLQAENKLSARGALSKLVAH